MVYSALLYCAEKKPTFSEWIAPADVDFLLRRLSIGAISFCGNLICCYGRRLYPMNPAAFDNHTESFHFEK